MWNHASNNSEKYLEAGSFVITNEPEFYFLNNKIEEILYILQKLLSK